MSSIDAGGGGLDEQIERVCAAERAAVCDLGDQPVFRVVLICVGDDEHRLVLTNHHIVMDGWSLPILVRELFASYAGQRLPAPASYRRFVSWLAGRDFDAARVAWGEVLAGFDTPTLVAPPGRVGLGRRAVASFRVPEQTTRAVAELARAPPHHRQHRVARRLHTAADGVDRSQRCRLWDDGLGAPGGGGRRGLDGGAVDQHRAGAGDHHRGHHHRRSAASAAERPEPDFRASAPGVERHPPRSPVTSTCSTPFSSMRTTRSTRRPRWASTGWP